MPIVEMHLYADEKVCDMIVIKNPADFIAGSIFPDCFWIGTDNYSADELDISMDKAVALEKYHFAVMHGELRYSNWVGFVCRYRTILSTSDFIKGNLFHLLLDYYTNSIWNSKVKQIESRYDIISDYGNVIHCSNITELCKYKYGDMLLYLNSKGQRDFKELLEPVSLKAGKDCLNAFGEDPNIVQKNIDACLKFMSSGDTAKALDSPLFYPTHYDYIVGKAVGTFRDIALMEQWK